MFLLLNFRDCAIAWGSVAETSQSVVHRCCGRPGSHSPSNGGGGFDDRAAYEPVALEPPISFLGDNVSGAAEHPGPRR